MPGGDFNFDRVAAEYDETRGGRARADDAARDLAAQLPGGDVLEIGVGTGIVAESLLRHAPQVRRLTGVDISAQMLDRARPRLPGRLVRASALRLPFPERAFDAVVAVHVLHLVPDLTATLAEARRVLRRGGRFVAIHGEPEPPDDELTDATRALGALRARRHDSPAEVRAAAEAAGLTCLGQHAGTPRVAHHSPTELADLISRRSWSHLWHVDDMQWRDRVEPVIDALRALPDPDRPRRQQASLTVTVLERG